jgi:hypothetical protein
MSEKVKVILTGNGYITTPEGKNINTGELELPLGSARAAVREGLAAWPPTTAKEDAKKQEPGKDPDPNYAALEALELKALKGRAKEAGVTFANTAGKAAVIKAVMEAGKAAEVLAAKPENSSNDADERAKAYAAIDGKYDLETLAEKAKALNVEFAAEADRDTVINAVLDAGKAVE